MNRINRASFPEVRQLQQQFEWLFGDATAGWRSTLTGEYPPLNITRDGQGVAIEALCPGVDRSTLDVTVVGETLTIRGERQSEPSVAPERYHRRERVTGSFARSVTVGDRLDPDKTEASYEDGILRVRASQAPQPPPKKIEIRG